MAPENDKNKEAIDFLIKPISDDQAKLMKKYLSPSAWEQLNSLKWLFIIRLGESENVEMPEKADFRNGLLKQSEDALRIILKSLSVQEEISYMQNKISKLKIKVFNKPEDEINEWQQRLKAVFD